MSDLIDRDSPDPPYVQVAAILRERIRSGQITSRLPGERTISQEFGIALLTARKAVRVLAAEGLVKVVRGWGSYVIPPEDRQK
jgi:GntR family transcriptional regulator